MFSWMNGKKKIRVDENRESMPRDETEDISRGGSEKKTKDGTGKKTLLQTVREMGMVKVVILFGVGIFLLFLSFPFDKKTATQTNNSAKNTNESNDSDSDNDYVSQLEKKLTDVLDHVDGVGENQVMITLLESGEKITLKDTTEDSNETVKEADSQGGTREQVSDSTKEESVLVEEDGDTSPYIVKETNPQVEGVVVVAQGGGSSQVQQEIVDAVQVLFGIEAHKIKVMKME